MLVKLLSANLLLLCFIIVQCKSDVKKLQIGIRKRVDDCLNKSKRGDFLHLHYTGTLEDGTEFDSSYPRGEPFTFTLGSGSVIKGWDQGLIGLVLIIF